MANPLITQIYHLGAWEFLHIHDDRLCGNTINIAINYQGHKFVKTPSPFFVFPSRVIRQKIRGRGAQVSSFREGRVPRHPPF
jgi:hypothetical protein